jgi:hypothetical protein
MLSVKTSRYAEIVLAESRQHKGRSKWLSRAAASTELHPDSDYIMRTSCYIRKNVMGDGFGARAVLDRGRVALGWLGYGAG